MAKTPKEGISCFMPNKKTLKPQQEKILENVPVKIYIEIDKAKKAKKVYAKGELNFEQLLLCIKSDTKVNKFDLMDITGFIFGGMSSRFWILKNKINLQKTELNEDQLCWNMITVQTQVEGKSINLIIPNQQDMDIFIQFLLQAQHQNYQIRVYKKNADKVKFMNP